jgi:hypothetical protein
MMVIITRLRAGHGAFCSAVRLLRISFDRRRECQELAPSIIYTRKLILVIAGDKRKAFAQGSTRDDPPPLAHASYSAVQQKPGSNAGLPSLVYRIKPMAVIVRIPYRIRTSR